jgi:hypothetical protein
MCAHRVLPGHVEREGVERDIYDLAVGALINPALLSTRRPVAGLPAAAAP